MLWTVLLFDIINTYAAVNSERMRSMVMTFLSISRVGIIYAEILKSPGTDVPGDLYPFLRRNGFNWLALLSQRLEHFLIHAALRARPSVRNIVIAGSGS